jgi:hypothetical protein
MAIQIVQVFPVGLVPGLESLETERGLRGFRRIESKEKLRQLRKFKDWIWRNKRTPRALYQGSKARCVRPSARFRGSKKNGCNADAGAGKGGMDLWCGASAGMTSGEEVEEG